MSYDFLLVTKPRGADPEATVRAWLSEPETGAGPGPVQPQKKAREQRLISLLQERNPLLAVQSPGGRAQSPDIELFDRDNGSGVHISFRPNSAAIAVPFWHQGEKVSGVFDEVWEYLKLLTEEGGMVAYDPQLDQVLDLQTDKLAVLKNYAKQ